MSKKNFSGVGIPKEQTPTEYFIGANNNPGNKKKTGKIKVYIKPIAIFYNGTGDPLPILSHSDAEELEQTGAIMDIDRFIELWEKGEYKKLPLISSQAELSKFYQDLETPKEEATRPMQELNFTNREEISAYTLKAPKELLEALKVLAMIQKSSIKELIIKALKEYLERNNEDYSKAKTFLKDYLNKGE